MDAWEGRLPTVLPLAPPVDEPLCWRDRLLLLTTFRREEAGLDSRDERWMSSEALFAREAAGTEKKDLSVLFAPEATDVVKEVLLAFSVFLRWKEEKGLISIF